MGARPGRTRSRARLSACDSLVNRVPGTGFFSYNSRVGHWTLEPVAEEMTVVSWERLAVSEGYAPDQWPLVRSILGEASPAAGRPRCCPSVLTWWSGLGENLGTNRRVSAKGRQRGPCFA